MTTGAALTDTALLERAMQPYVAKKAVLLQKVPSVAASDGEITIVGEFSIGESCYIDDTGHFNAVELVISYNQLMYTALAYAVRDGLAPELQGWTMDDFWQRQLPNVLITRLDSSYRRPLNPKAYRGTLTMHDFTFRNRSRPILGFASHMQFSDDAAGHAFVEVDMAITDPVGYT